MFKSLIINFTYIRQLNKMEVENHYLVKILTTFLHFKCPAKNTFKAVMRKKFHDFLKTLFKLNVQSYERV